MKESENRPRPDDYFSDWKQREVLAEAMIPLIGKLYRENSVNCCMYGRPMVNTSTIGIMKAHRYVRQVENNELSEFQILTEEFVKLKFCSCHKFQ